MTKLCVLGGLAGLVVQPLAWDSLNPALPRWGVNLTLLGRLGRGFPQREPVRTPAAFSFCPLQHTGCQLCLCTHELLLFQIIMENLAVEFLGWD